MDFPQFLIVILVAAVGQPPETSASTSSVPQLNQPKGPDEEIIVTGEKPEAEPDKKVCRRQVPTGSIMPKITCRTVSEWEDVTAKSIADVERLRADRRIRQHVQDSREN